MDGKKSGIKGTVSMKLATTTHHRFSVQARNRGMSQNDYLQNLMDMEEKSLPNEQLHKIHKEPLQDSNRYILNVKNAFIEIELMHPDIGKNDLGTS